MHGLIREDREWRKRGPWDLLASKRDRVRRVAQVSALVLRSSSFPKPFTCCSNTIILVISLSPPHITLCSPWLCVGVGSCPPSPGQVNQSGLQLLRGMKAELEEGLAALLGSGISWGLGDVKSCARGAAGTQDIPLGTHRWPPHPAVQPHNDLRGCSIEDSVPKQQVEGLYRANIEVCPLSAQKSKACRMCDCGRGRWWL